MPSNYMEARLIAGTLDLAFFQLPVPESLKGIALAEERLMLAIPTQNITVLEIDYHPLHYVEKLVLIKLMPEKGRRFYQQIDNFLTYHQVTPCVLQQLPNIQTQLSLVVARLGVAFVPKSAALLGNKKRVTLLPLSGIYTQ